MADVNPRPVIQDLQPGDWIDLDQLGNSPLLTYVKYPDIAINDVLWPNWRGCSAQGEVHDHETSRVDVTVGGGYTPERGMPVHIPNDVLTILNQGWAFYSYAVGASHDPSIRGPESLRVFCYVGKRPENSASVPVPHIKESHELALDPDAVSSAGATAVVPPYRAMSVGDKVTFTWQGYFLGQPDIPYQEEKEIKIEHVGQPLLFTVPYIDVLSGEYTDISYRIEYAGGAGLKSDSEPQRIQLIKPVAPVLPPITVKGYTGGPISPGKYPNGLTLQVKPVYADIREGDWVLVYWTGTEKAKSVTKALRVDRSTLDSGLIELLIEPQWLTSNSNSQVTVIYQFARAGVAKSAESLTLDISKPLNLPPPIVEGANAGGSWPASTGGAYVNVPDTAETGGGRVEMHWQGHENGGRHIASTPVSGKRFFIPSTAIAANMSTLEKARFPVFYRVFSPGVSDSEDSVPFNLLIGPLPLARYPFTTCVQVLNNELSLFNVPLGGADLVIGSPPSDAWPFMAEGQLLTMQLSGVDWNGNQTTTVLRNAVPVSEFEFKNKRALGKLPKEHLQKLKLNESFTLSARVSFDGGETFVPFNDSRPTLVA
jgi:hypothetical protein